MCSLDWRRVAPALVVFVSLCGGVRGAAMKSPPATGVASRPARIAAPSARVMRVLRLLQKRAQTLHNFTADVRVKTQHLRTDETDIDIGRIWYQRRGSRTRFDIRLNTLVVDGAIAKRHADHDIIFDGRWLIDRNGAAKIFRKTAVAPPGRRFNPLELGAGPIPIPIGQNPAEVLREFTVSLRKNRRRTPGIIHLRLTPRQKNMFTFKILDFQIDRKIRLPVKIVRINSDGSPTTATLRHVRINQKMRHHFPVQTPPAGSGWTVEIHHWKDRPGQ